MITSVTGVLVQKQPMRVVLEAGGIGYEIFIPLSSFDKLPPADGTCRLLTYDYIREDQHALYGFATEQERRVFVLLLSVSGVGPKIALGVLSGLSHREIIATVTGGDIKRLSSVSGVGRKKAERIVIELRDKIGEGEAVEAFAGAPATEEEMKTRDAILALVSLGYKQNEARELIRKTLAAEPSLQGVEEIIRKALANAG